MKVCFVIPSWAILLGGYTLTCAVAHLIWWAVERKLKASILNQKVAMRWSMAFGWLTFGALGSAFQLIYFHVVS